LKTIPDLNFLNFIKFGDNMSTQKTLLREMKERTGITPLDVLNLYDSLRTEGNAYKNPHLRRVLDSAMTVGSLQVGGPVLKVDDSVYDKFIERSGSKVQGITSSAKKGDHDDFAVNSLVLLLDAKEEGARQNQHLPKSHGFLSLRSSEQY